jgi:fructose-1,6-bisphosphatase/inositol monophosphatase family enzyme
MSFLPLAARVCHAFTTSRDGAFRTVQKVKDQQSRDVVTGLDERLHDITASYLAEHVPTCRLLSEEGRQTVVSADALRVGEWLIVDPLDGSNNYALGLPGYGYMAAHLVQGRIAGTLVVLPEHDQYMLDEDGALLASQPFGPTAAAPSGTVYYAYPPKLGDKPKQARTALIDCIDKRSSGLYRSGSACIGLYNLLRGKHLGFVGHGIRIWDALAYFPLLTRYNIPVRYRLTPTALTMVASADAGFLKEAGAIIEAAEGVNLVRYAGEDPLVIV